MLLPIAHAREGRPFTKEHWNLTAQWLPFAYAHERRLRLCHRLPEISCCHSRTRARWDTFCPDPRFAVCRSRTRAKGDPAGGHLNNTLFPVAPAREMRPPTGENISDTFPFARVREVRPSAGSPQGTGRQLAGRARARGGTGQRDDPQPLPPVAGRARARGETPGDTVNDGPVLVAGRARARSETIARLTRTEARRSFRSRTRAQSDGRELAARGFATVRLPVAQAREMRPGTNHPGSASARMLPFARGREVRLADLAADVQAVRLPFAHARELGR